MGHKAGHYFASFTVLFIMSLSDSARFKSADEKLADKNAPLGAAGRDGCQQYCKNA